MQCSRRSLLEYVAFVLVAFSAIMIGQERALADSQFAIIGDAGNTTTGSRVVRESILRARVPNLILPGDNLYGGTYENVWKPWKAANFVFDVVAIGNHNAGYSKEIAFFEMPGEYYSKVIDGARFIVLNSDNDSTGKAQAAWLDSELKTATEALVFVVYHHPSYTISKVHEWEEKRRFQLAVRPVFWRHRAKISALIVGHDHLATLVHFNDLPVIVSGAVHDQRADLPVNYVLDGVTVKTAWYFDRKPYWARLSYSTGANEARVDFIRATDDKTGCTALIRTGAAAVLEANCMAPLSMNGEGD